MCSNVCVCAGCMRTPCTLMGTSCCVLQPYVCMHVSSRWLFTVFMYPLSSSKGVCYSLFVFERLAFIYCECKDVYQLDAL